MGEAILNSWKEIAQYVGRGVRTLQRWERELGFPVRRPRSHQRSAVIAFPAEVDAWLKDAQTRHAKRKHVPEVYQQLSRNAVLLASRTQSLNKHRESLRQQIRNTMSLSTKLRAKRTAARQARLEKAHASKKSGD